MKPVCKKQVLIAVSAAAVMSMAVPGAAKARRFSLHVFAFMGSDRHPAVKVKSITTYGNLVFLKKGNRFESVYDLFITVKNRNGKVVDTAVLKDRASVRSYKETKSNRQSSKLSRSFKLKPGRYTVEAALIVRNTMLRMEKVAVIDVPDFIAGGLGVSKPRFFVTALEPPSRGTAIIAAPDAGSEAFIESEYAIFAEFNKYPAVLVEISTENLPADTLACKLYFEVIGRSREQLFYANKNMTLTGMNDRYMLLLNADDWDPGNYTLNVKAVLDNPRREAASSMRFTVEFSRAMLGKRFKETLAILALIASPEELEFLQKADTADRARAWEEFWKKRDPNPETPVNEALDEYLRRVRFAVENFSLMDKGWKTDRGKVYIKYGPPDQEETTVDPYMQGEYLIWRYFSRNLTFVFFDRFGLGEYHLVSARSF